MDERITLGEANEHGYRPVYVDGIHIASLAVDTHGTFPHVPSSSFQLGETEEGAPLLSYVVNNGQQTEDRGLVLHELSATSITK